MAKDMCSFSDIFTGCLIGSILALAIRYLLERWSEERIQEVYELKIRL